jgi:GxxExxY protein
MGKNENAKKILDAAFMAHTKLGPGLLESVYEVVLAHELRKAGLLVERQKPMPITYDGILFEEGYRADLLGESKVIVELKSVAAISAVPQFRLSGLKLGLLINFGETHLKNGIKRIINGELEPEASDLSL